MLNRHPESVLQPIIRRLTHFSNSKSGYTLLIILAITLPLIALALILARYAVNVPFWDQWELVDMFKKHDVGTLGFADFFAQHNEHRLFFPRLIMVGLALVTSWNTLYEVAVNVILASTSIVFLYLMLRKAFENKLLVITMTGLTSLILFSPVQMENWLWGWQLQWFLSVLGLVVALWALSTWEASSSKKLVIASSGALVATYSLASGAFVWFVCLPFFFKPLTKRLLPVWLGISFVAIGTYYIGYHDPTYHASKTFFLTEPIAFVKYVMIYIARPVTLDYSIALPFATLYISMIALTLFYSLRRQLRTTIESLLPWLSLGLYAILAAGSTAVSRLNLGIIQAYSSRYATISSLLLISVCVLLAKLADRNSVVRTVRMAAVITVTCLSILVSAVFIKGVLEVRRYHVHLEAMSRCAQTAKTASDPCLLLLYPSQQVVWERLEYIRIIHWGGQ